MDMSYNEYLAHYGTKGMKWGVRNKEPRLGRPDKSEIMKARRSVSKERKAFKAKQKEVRSLRDPKDIEKGKSELGAMRVSLLKNPDRVTASRMTKGEIVATALLGTPGFALTALAGTSLQSKSIAERQKSGYYDRNPRALY